ncbi:hypothetical protein [Cohnella terricola]|uniref:Mrr-like domain-containing protein n=1 Tax=Cohnella terricola TaxID=1289167 RepID=A0A559JBS5_9BACL|nr:hypothetical protein [Cohnella terricola]TVX97336.1 hypothetical protein FPZ45_18530 [Cohnella terricola]
MYDYIKIPEITDGIKFESLIHDLYAVYLERIQKNGRSGQSQNGVDIYGYDSKQELVGIQCKVKSKADISERNFRRSLISEIKSEAERASNFNKNLKKFLFTTTAPRDSSIQNEIIDLDKEVYTLYGFNIQVLFWDDICDMLTRQKHKETFIKYYNDLIIREEIIGAVKSKVLSLVVGIASPENYSGFRDESLYQLVLGYIPKLNKYPNGIEYYSNSYILGCFQTRGMDTFPIPCYPSDLEYVFGKNRSYRDVCTIAEWINSIDIDKEISNETREYEYLWSEERFQEYIDQYVAD